MNERVSTNIVSYPLFVNVMKNNISIISIYIIVCPSKTG